MLKIILGATTFISGMVCVLSMLHDVPVEWLLTAIPTYCITGVWLCIIAKKGPDN
jgi:hypothetical protein